MMNDLAPGLGAIVAYTDSEGQVKPATVLGTDMDDSRLPDLADGELNLVVFSATGSVTVRTNIPRDDDGGKPRTYSTR